MNKWRRVRGDDDGCTIYQCLKCKEDWSSRTEPASARYPSGFVFCPYCGTRWEGEHEWGYDMWPNTLGYEVDYYPYVQPARWIGWIIQTVAYWRQEDGSYREESGEDSSKPSIDAIVFNVGAKTIKDLADFQRAQRGERDDDEHPPLLKYVTRVSRLKHDSREWKLAQERGSYNHRSNRWEEGDPQYWEEYRKQWGGKRHHSLRRRGWYRRPLSEEEKAQHAKYLLEIEERQKGTVPA